VDALQLEFGAMLRSAEMRVAIAEAVGEAIVRTIRPMNSFLQTIAPAVHWTKEQLSAVEAKLRRAHCYTPIDLANRLQLHSQVHTYPQSHTQSQTQPQSQSQTQSQSLNRALDDMGAKKFSSKTIALMRYLLSAGLLVQPGVDLNLNMNLHALSIQNGSSSSAAKFNGHSTTLSHNFGTMAGASEGLLSLLQERSVGQLGPALGLGLNLGPMHGWVDPGLDLELSLSLAMEGVPVMQRRLVRRIFVYGNLRDDLSSRVKESAAKDSSQSSSSSSLLPEASVYSDWLQGSTSYAATLPGFALFQVT
jgi:hypothetical protein